MIKLVSVDVNGTIGHFVGKRTVEVLSDVSHALPAVIEEEARRVLHRAPLLTAEVIAEICSTLLIDPQHWPNPWPEGGFRAYDGISELLTTLSIYGPVVALSNASITEHPSVVAMREECDYLDAIYTSYELAERKPSPRLWRHIAHQHSVTVETMVHIGDQWYNDCYGAKTAGCGAICIRRKDRSEPPPITRWPGDPQRSAIVDSLAEAVQVVHEWASQ